MRRSLLAAVAVAALALALAAPAGAKSGNAASAADKAQAEHQRIADYWTAERRASAKPRDIVLPLGTKASPNAKPSKPGSGGNVLGAAWTSGGSVAATTGKVFFTSGGSRYVCSGSVVDSEHGNLVLTAGHCAHDGAGGSYVTDFAFYPRYRSGADSTLGVWTVANGNLLTTDEWATTANAFENDAAFAKVTPRANGQTLEQAIAAAGGIIPTMNFSHPADNTKISAFGYPAAGKYNGQTLTYCSGPVLTGYDREQTLSIPCDMTGGSSGGPWFNPFTTSYSGSLNSLNSYGYSSLKRMFGPIFDGPEQQAYTAFD